jgi:hypothetical protein
MINPDELAADAAEQQQSQKKLSLAEVQLLCENLWFVEGQIASLESELSEVKSVFRDLAEKRIPEAFNDLGLKSLQLTDGTTINLQDMIAATINDENRAAAHNWLRENGYGDIIKNEIIVSFGKDEDKYADVIYDRLVHEGGLQPMRQEKVHPSTLKAFVKERLKSGEPFPADTFKLFVGVAARVNKKGK